MESQMPDWRDKILKEFIPHVTKLTLVCDPDSLITEEKLAMELRKRGFDIIEYSDSVEFRYAYESKYRSLWDEGTYTDLVVILRLPHTDINELPYDLIRAGRRLSFSLADVFPHMSYPVVEHLDSSMLDALFDAQHRLTPETMGDNSTKDFILRHVFGVAPELITTDVELLRFLLRLHYSQRSIPLLFAHRLVSILEQNTMFKKWPIESIVCNSGAFFSFLQDHWFAFICSKFPKQCTIAPHNTPCSPSMLPFDHHDIRVYMDNLFIEGKLTPIKIHHTDIPKSSWISCGITSSHTDMQEIRMSRLIDRLKHHGMSVNSTYHEWMSIAQTWAELSSIIHVSDECTFQTMFNDLEVQINTLFAEWLRSHYASLINLPPSSPVMLHHIPRAMYRECIQSKHTRIALIVIDGLSLAQWVTIRSELSNLKDLCVMKEMATFAWIPTLTSVSRQALFSGTIPLYFPSSINTTNNEEKLWKIFWNEQGYKKKDVIYKRGLGDEDVEQMLSSFISPSKSSILGFVVNKVDKIMHGMQLGSRGMHNQIEQWSKTKYLSTMISVLINNGYTIWITSDHGNTEAKGTGTLMEGSVVETKGERVRIYPSNQLRSKAAATLINTLEWPSFGLPEKYYPLIATCNSAFIKDGQIAVCHGGVSLEEVIVPLIKLESR